MKEKIWLAAYLYCAEDTWNHFLVDHVNPFADQVLKKKMADQYFFIRYWERGPHIRLRFKGDKSIIEKKLRPHIEKYFLKYFKKNPSKRNDPEWLSKLPINQQWFPNDTIQYIEYEPEIERYGGTTGIVIAEKQFEASSNAVLGVIKESGDWNYDRALGAAIQMHLGFSAAMGMSLKELKYFSSLIYTSWFPRAYSYNPNRGEKETKKIKEVILKAFDDNFLKQKSTLITFHQTIWNALKTNVEFEQDWFNNWVKDMKKINKKLHLAQKKTN